MNAMQGVTVPRIHHSKMVQNSCFKMNFLSIGILLLMLTESCFNEKEKIKITKYDKYGIKAVMVSHLMFKLIVLVLLIISAIASRCSSNKNGQIGARLSSDLPYRK